MYMSFFPTSFNLFYLKIKKLRLILKIQYYLKSLKNRFLYLFYYFYQFFFFGNLFILFIYLLLFYILLFVNLLPALVSLQKKTNLS